MPHPSEICTVIIGGQEYVEWEAVQVQIEFPGIFRRFMLAVSEQAPMARQFNELRIKPGDSCTVLLGNAPVISGYVYERQTYLDANKHGIQITGQSKAGDTIRTGIEIDKLGNGGQFQNQTLPQIANKVLQPYGITAIPMGDQSDMNVPIEDAQVHPGDSPFHFIERYARGRAYIGDDINGNYILHGGLSGGGSSGAELVEGENIQWCRITLNDMEVLSKGTAWGQSRGTSEQWGGKTSHQEDRRDGTAPRYKPHLFLVEPGLGPKTIKQELKMRLDYEMSWREGTKITADIGVYGWFKLGGGLWGAGPDELVYVYSPSAMVTENLAVKKVTFLQNNEVGTMTTLELVNPAFYGGKGTQWK
jgi:prophage tail gpP-like protein